MTIYLASKSPRRKELLQQMNISFQLLSVDIPEVVKAGELPDAYSTRITKEKCFAAWETLINETLPPQPILCADTEVILGDEILGKPQDKTDAFNMIKRYSGQTHRVITSVGMIYQDYQAVKTNTTLVTFSEMTDQDIQKYVNTGDYKGKSGSYGIQSYIGQFISHIDGCFYSVMGLPLNTVREMLNTLNSNCKMTD